MVLAPFRPHWPLLDFRLAPFENYADQSYFEWMSAKHPYNGATFTKGKPIKAPPPPPDPGGEAGQLAVDRLDAAKSREFAKRVKKDGLVRALFPDIAFPTEKPIKRRKMKT